MVGLVFWASCTPSLAAFGKDIDQQRIEPGSAAYGSLNMA